MPIKSQEESISSLQRTRPAQRWSLAAELGVIRTLEPDAEGDVTARRLVACTALLVAAPAIAAANAGIPMLAVMWPSAFLLLLPIVGLESLVAQRTFQLPLAEAGRHVFVANLVSTAVGMPVTWGLLVVLELVMFGLVTPAMRASRTWQLALSPLAAPWLPPLLPENEWWVWAAAAWLCVPFFAASVLVEWFILRGRLPNATPQSLRRWALRANVLTYSLLIAYTAAAAVIARPD